MKNTLLIILFASLLPTLIFAQLYPLKPQTDRVAFKVVNVSGDLGLQYDTLPQTGDFPQIISITMENADLVVNYKYKGLNSKYTRDVVKIISIQTGPERPILPERRDLRQQDQAIKIKKGMEGSVSWLDLGEEILTMGEYYILTIERNIQLDVNCEDPRPQFKFKDQWPHYAIAAVGVGVVGVGQVFRKKKEAENEWYHDAWRSGASETTAKPFYDHAKDYDTKTKIFSVVGYTILVGDIIWYFYRKKDIKRKQGLYDEFCIGKAGSTLKVEPTFEWSNASAINSSSAGLSIVLKF